MEHFEIQRIFRVFEGSKIINFLGDFMAFYFICFVYSPKQGKQLYRIACSCAYADAQWSFMSENCPESIKKYLNYYCISSYGFHGNYSFLNLKIQRSQYKRPKITVYKCEETIQGRKLFKDGNYMRKYGNKAGYLRLLYFEIKTVLVI